MPTAVCKPAAAPRICNETCGDKTRTVPIEFMAGLFSMFPDTPWIPHCVGNNPRGELRSVGVIAISQSAFSPGSSCSLHFAADVDCTLEIFLLSHNLELSWIAPTWNSVSADRKWHVPGGISEADGRLLGAVEMKVGQVGVITINGEFNDGKLNRLPRRGLLIRRRDMGMQTVSINGELKMERTSL